MDAVTGMQRVGAAIGATAASLVLLSGIGALADEQVRNAFSRQEAAESKTAVTPARRAAARPPALADCRPGAARAG